MSARDEIKRKLDAFIAPVKEGVDIPSGTPPFDDAKRAPLVKAATTKDAKGKPVVTEAEVKAAGATNNDVYIKLTGLSHVDEVTNWCNGGHLTSCNSFAGTASIAMGSKIFLGAFNLLELLTKHNKQHAFIPWGKGEKPDYGDIFTRWTTDALHQGVSLGFASGSWKTIEGGQGGWGAGVDYVGRRTRNFEASRYDGFVDMVLVQDPRGPMPDWLIGTWVIYCGKEVYYYKIKRTWEVAQFPWKPAGTNADGTPVEPVAIDTGTVNMTVGDRFEITWTKEGGKESFEYLRWESFPTIMEKCKGKSAKGEDLRGVRM